MRTIKAKTLHIPSHEWKDPELLKLWEELDRFVEQQTAKIRTRGAAYYNELEAELSEVSSNAGQRLSADQMHQRTQRIDEIAEEQNRLRQNVISYPDAKI